MNNVTGQMTPPPRAASTSTTGWTTTGTCLPPSLTGYMRSGHRTGFCGAPWSRTSTPSRFRSLDVPEPQMGNQLVEVLQKIDTRSSHQVIEVPKIFPVSVPQRRVESRPPQLAEQLVEVPTDPAYALGALISSALGGGLQGSLPEQDSLRLQRAVEQILNNPVPQGRREAWWRSSRFTPWTEFNSSGRGADRLIFLHVAVFKVSPQARDQVVDIPVVVQTQIPMVRFTIEILQLQYIDQVVNVCCAGPASSCAVVGDSRDPTVETVVRSRVACPLCAMTFAHGSMSSSTVVNVPVIMQRRLCSGSASDSVHRQSPWTVQLCNGEW